MFKVCSHICTVATNVVQIKDCIDPSSCIYYTRTQHSPFEHRTLHSQHHTYIAQPSEHQTTQAETITANTTCVLRIGTTLALQPDQLSPVCGIAVDLHKYNTTDTNIRKLPHPAMKHRSTSKHRRQRRSTKQHHTRYTSQHRSHRSTTPSYRRHTSQHRSCRRQHHSPTVRSRSNHRPGTRHRTTSLRQHTPPRHRTSLPQPPSRPRPLPPPPLPPQHHGPRDQRWCIHSTLTLTNITKIWVREPGPNFITPTQHLHGHEPDDVELPSLSMDVQIRGC